MDKSWIVANIIVIYLPYGCFFKGTLYKKSIFKKIKNNFKDVILVEGIIKGYKLFTCGFIGKRYHNAYYVVVVEYKGKKYKLITDDEMDKVGTKMKIAIINNESKRHKYAIFECEYNKIKKSELMEN